MKKLCILILALIVSACSLPGDIYRSPSSVVKKTNYELCRALYDVDERRQASGDAIRVLDGEIERRGGNKEACFDLFLAKHGQNTIC